ncbi:MAG: hypothetical protein IJ192_13015 [Clostridia bacterium]|nr:hypothetical protein [Clostridia bacterium]
MSEGSSTMIVGFPMTILIVCGIVLAIMLLVISLYFFIYRYRINKVLKEGKPAKFSMPSIGTAMFSVWFIVWVAATVFVLFQFQVIIYSNSELSNQLDNMHQRLNEIQEEIPDISSMVKSQSLIMDYEYQFGDYHAEDHTIDINLSMIPKSAGENDQYTFKMGDSETKLKSVQDGVNLYFQGTVRIDIFDRNYAGILILDAGNQKLYEVLNLKENDDNGEWIRYFPYIESSVDTSYETDEDDEVSYYEGQETMLENYITITSCPARYDKNHVFTELTLEVDFNETKIDEVDLLHSDTVQTEENTYALNLKEKIDFEPSRDVIQFYINAKDNHGYSYRISISRISNTEDTDLYNSCIMNKDGKTLFNFQGDENYADNGVIDNRKFE